ncbi:MAG: RpiB/LacA/LacB family sugar-phosphate isomerase [Ardenticatenales bacterium]|nr:RpiB/LacA/LacB family sugar-phosphate isomerase [Ardenticatenales bacterium]
MIIAVGSDEANAMTEALLHALVERGHTLQRFGALGDGNDEDWPLMARNVGRAVASGQAAQGIVCCWTGTGASIAANKVRGVRAALCHDAETARGARIWNHANVLALSLRATSAPVMAEILEAWFATPIDSGEAQSAWNREQMARIDALEVEESSQ